MVLHARRRLRFSVIALAGVALVPACNALFGIEDYPPRPAECDPNSPEDACGANGACVITRPLGGKDFCAPKCNPEAGSESRDFACLSSSRKGAEGDLGARVRTCQPSALDPGCPRGLQCYRTDLDFRDGDRGVCMAMPVCNTAADCKDPENPECATEVLKELYPEVASLLKTNNLHCLSLCASAAEEAGTTTTCPSGEHCLSDFETYRELPDICVPSCANQACPVNFHCLTDDGPGYPDYCVPGLPGYRCTREQDCMLGKCVRIDSELSVCSVDCDNDAQCALLDPLRGPFICVKGDAARPEQGICVSAWPFAGPPCREDEDCPQDIGPQTCSDYLPLTPDLSRTQTLGDECHRSCNADTPCPARGGVPFVCLPNDECYPGVFGVPCRSPGRSDCMGDPECECMGKLRCECVEGCTPSVTEASTAICTIECETDEDCADYNLTASGVCQNGFCRPVLE